MVSTREWTCKNRCNAMLDPWWVTEEEWGYPFVWMLLLLMCILICSVLLRPYPALSCLLTFPSLGPVSCPSIQPLRQSREREREIDRKGERECPDQRKLFMFSKVQWSLWIFFCCWCCLLVLFDGVAFDCLLLSTMSHKKDATRQD